MDVMRHNAHWMIPTLAAYTIFMTGAAVGKHLL